MNAKSLFFRRGGNGDKGGVLSFGKGRMVTGMVFFRGGQAGLSVGREGRRKAGSGPGIFSKKGRKSISRKP